MSVMLIGMIGSVTQFLDGALAGVFVASTMVEHAVRPNLHPEPHRHPAP